MLRSRLAADEGFTLVELLVTILIVGILAAIALAAFLGQRSKSEDAEAKVYVTAATKAMVIYGDDHDGFSAATPADLAKIEPSLGTARGLRIVADDRSFTVTVDSTSGDQGGGSFSVARSDTGDITRTCANPGSGACLDTPDAHGNSW